MLEIVQRAFEEFRADLATAPQITLRSADAIYAVRHAGDPKTMVVDGALTSLRPPDRDPPRLASLTFQQEAVVRAFLRHAATSGAAAYHAALAQVVLEEWWVPNARYRRRPAAGREEC